MMTRSEMIDTVQKLLVSEGTREDLDALLAELINAAPFGNISDLIYYPNCDRTAEQIVDEAILCDRLSRAKTALRY